jgi:hypothetical protein
LLQVKEGGRHWPRREGGGARARTIIIAVLEEDPHRYSLSCLGHVALEDLGGAVSHRCVDLPCLLERGVKPGHRLVVATGHPARPSRRATIGLSHRAITWPPLARCGLLHGSSDFRDKGGREGNGWIGAKGEDISGEKRLGFLGEKTTSGQEPARKKIFSAATLTFQNLGACANNSR